MNKCDFCTKSSPGRTIFKCACDAYPGSSYCYEAIKKMNERVQLYLIKPDKSIPINNLGNVMHFKPGHID